MMTMEMGMYGQQHPYNTTTYSEHHHQTASGGNANYCPDTIPGAYHPHQQTTNLYHHSNYDHHENYHHLYSGHHHQPHLDNEMVAATVATGVPSTSPSDLGLHFYPENHPPIINTDNGLSYTNLDYGSPNSYGSYSNHGNDESNNESPSFSHHLQDGNILESVNYPHIVMHCSSTNNASPPNSTNCMEYNAHRHYKEETLTGNQHYTDNTQSTGGGTPGHLLAHPSAYHLHGNVHSIHHTTANSLSHHHHQHQQVNNNPNVITSSQSSSSTSSAVPTYKWMQVKRNVPKPVGKFVQYLKIDN